MKNQQIIDAADNCKKAGINRLTFNIVGAPLETAANMRETLKLNQRIAPEHFFFFRTFLCAERPCTTLPKKKGCCWKPKNLHYSAANDRQFTLNMKERPNFTPMSTMKSVRKC